MLRLVLPFLLAILFAALLISCDQFDAWRDGQVAESKRIAKGSKIDPPAQPVSIPDSLRSELPLDGSFTVLTYSEQGGTASLTALSPWNAEKTALWLVQRLGELGYDSGDNASRVLEGATYSKGSGGYRSLYVKLGLNTSEQCTVEYRATSG
jgi:hypothetical protein